MENGNNKVFIIFVLFYLGFGVSLCCLFTRFRFILLRLKSFRFCVMLDVVLCVLFLWSRLFNVTWLCLLLPFIFEIVLTLHTHTAYTLHNYIYANAHRITFNMDTNLKHVHNLNKTVLNVLWQDFTCFVVPPTPMTDFVCVVMKTQRTDCVLKCKFTQLTHVSQWYYSYTIQYHSNAYIKCVYVVHLHRMYIVLYCIVCTVCTTVCIAYVLTANVISTMLRYSKSKFIMLFLPFNALLFAFEEKWIFIWYGYDYDGSCHRQHFVPG